MSLKLQHGQSRAGSFEILAAVVAFTWLWVGTALAGSVEGAIDLEAAEGGPVFSYRGDTGPAHWAALDDEWALCGTGTEQSPIDFDALGAVPEAVSDISFDYHESIVKWVNNAHTVMLEYEPGSRMTLDGETYELLQFHFHTPSEHSIQGGARFALELHLVHRNGAGELAVVGVMMREGEHNRGLPGGRRLDQYLPKVEGVVVEFPLDTLDASGLLPAGHRSFRYDGSLTTPPCSEGVRWIVMTEPIEISRSQMRALVRTLQSLRYSSQSGANNRPTQPLNGRVVQLDEGG